MSSCVLSLLFHVTVNETIAVSLMPESHSQRLRIYQVLHRAVQWESPLMRELTTCTQGEAQHRDANRQEKDQAPKHWDCSSLLTKEQYGGICLSAKKVFNRDWYNEHFGGLP